MLSGTLSKKDLFEVEPPSSYTASNAESPEIIILISSDNKIYAADQQNNDIYEFNNDLTSYTRIGAPKSRMSIAKELTYYEYIICDLFNFCVFYLICK